MAISNILNSNIGNVASGFALDISRRISRSKGLNAVQPGQEIDPEAAAAQEEKLGQLQKLENALGATVSYMANTHGEKAASAMIGIMYKSLGEGEVNETTLGNALLDVVRFVDANFGFDKGDAFMSHLNGSLNDSLNAFFDNGQNETFFAASSLGENGGGGLDMPSLLEQLTEQMKDDIMTMLEEARAKPEPGSPAAAYGVGNGPVNSPVNSLVNGQSALQGVLKDVMV